MLPFDALVASPSNLSEFIEAARDVALFVWHFVTGLFRRVARGAWRMVSNNASKVLPIGKPTAASAPGTEPPPRRRRSWLFRLGAWAIVALILCGAAAWTGVVMGERLLDTANVRDLPKINKDAWKQSSTVRAADGEIIYSFAEERRDLVTHAEISPYIIDALVAVEDEQFFEHHGINPRGIARAVVRDLQASMKAGKLVFPQGGSSLTQQLAKQLFTDQKKTMDRKVNEALYALHIETNYSKQEILEAYLNLVFLGHQRYGVESAAQYYFGKSAMDVTLPEAALLAGLPQRPSGLSPRLNPTAALARRNHVLDRMAESGKITVAQAEEAKATPIELASSERQKRLETQQAAPFFVEDVRRHLMERPELTDLVMTGGLEIDTTLDMTAQRKATRAVRDGLRKLDKQLTGFRPITNNLLDEGVDPDAFEHPLWMLPPQADDVLPGVVVDVSESAATVRIAEYRVPLDRASIKWTERKKLSDVMRRGDVAPFRVTRDETGAVTGALLEQAPLLEGSLVAIDVATGEVIAMVGGYDYNTSEYNKASQAWRQAGSSFKPIYYATALERGLRPSSTMLDEPTVFIDPWNGETYKPENYYKTYFGRVTMREALERSLNIASVRLLNYVGYEHAIKTARKCGITAKLHPYPSMALGAAETTLLEMTSAFGVFPNGGLHVQPTLLRRVRDPKGNVLFETKTEGAEAMSPQTAFLITQLLVGVVQDGTAEAAKVLGRPVAGKTGTTDNYSDAWFIGYTPSVVVGVWAGHEKEQKSIGKDYAGAKAALPIWIDFMRSYLQDKPVEQFTSPGDIAFVAVDRRTGLVASMDCPKDDVFREAFAEDNRPFESCSGWRHQQLSLPRCLQRFTMDGSGVLVIPSEAALFELELPESDCPVMIDREQHVIEHGWAAAGVPAAFPYRFGIPDTMAMLPDSIESLMSADRRTTKSGALSDFDMIDGRTVIVVRNTR